MMQLNSNELPKYLVNRLSLERKVDNDYPVFTPPTMDNQHAISETIATGQKGAFDRSNTDEIKEAPKTKKLPSISHLVNGVDSHRNERLPQPSNSQVSKILYSAQNHETYDRPSVSLSEPERPHQYNVYRASTGYPLTTNQALHVNIAYFISMMNMSLYYQEHYQNMLKNSEAMKLQLETPERHQSDQDTAPERVKK